MQKRKFDELISHFNRKVSDMSIDQKYKMELLGMISAIGFAHEKELSTNLADVGTDCISRQAAIEAIDSFNVFESRSDQIKLEQMIGELPPVQPEPSQVAKDIARIVENGQDMRVIGQPEIIFCKDCKKHNKHYHESPYKDTVCPLTAWRGKARGHEYDYQYCCFAERREVTT